VKFRTNGDEMNLEGAGKVLYKGGGSHNLGATTGEPGREPVEVSKIGCV
jgi:hypothetical protein